MTTQTKTKKAAATPARIATASKPTFGEIVNAGPLSGKCDQCGARSSDLHEKQMVHRARLVCRDEGRCVTRWHRRAFPEYEPRADVMWPTREMLEQSEDEMPLDRRLRASGAAELFEGVA